MEMHKSFLQLLEDKNYQELKELLISLEPADVAVHFSELSERHRAIMFRLLPKETAAEVFVELDPDMQEALIIGFSDNELKEIVDELYVDDAVDIIEEMPANVVSRILRHADSEMRRDINQMLRYPPDSAGSIMTTEYVNLRKDMTVEDAFTHIRRKGTDKETIYTCYVTDNNRILEGLVTVKDLLLNDYSCTLEEIMETNIIYVNTTDDQEYAASQFEKYDFLALPVVDKEKRIVGIITVDDAIDVITEEATEDIEKMAAIIPSDKPYLRTGVFEIFRQRIPWLLLMMLSATFTQSIINHYEAAFLAYGILTSFIPMLMGTGGNSGSQSSVTIIRSLSLGDITFRDTLKVMFKELRVAILCGITLGVVNFAKLAFIDRAGVDISLIVSSALVGTVLFAKLVGCSLPMLAKKLHLDPAVMASPFITTIVDAISLVIYFDIATKILNI
ncbi:MAG: magnesium transporter [Clostridia bacterium]|nr:magnesium transporter [Clostridia bacterium]